MLINGRRQAAAGAADYVDVSMIPLSAIERIEVLADGASAIYGSDAIGGVVNFVMRHNYTGAETRLRAATTSEGGGEELQAAQSLGIGWTSGNALVSYEFYKENPINALQRDFSKDNTNGGSVDLIAGQKRNSAYVSGEEDLSSAIKLTGDLTFSQRDSTEAIFNPATASFSKSASINRSYGGSLGLDIQVAPSWHLAVSGGSSRTTLAAHDVLYNSSVALTDSDYQIHSAEVKLDGSLHELRAGAIKLAVGGARRQESYDYTQTSLPSDFVASVGRRQFHVDSAFAEVLVPLLEGFKDTPNVPRLALSLAGRIEKYSNFGDAHNPKIGLEWVATNAVKMRASYGTSFKAPNLSETFEGGFSTGYLLSTVVDPQFPGGVRTAAIRVGNNAKLGPETATTWTTGLDFVPQDRQALRAHLTWFNIQYRNQITAIPYNPLLAIYNPAYAPIRLVRGTVPDSQFNAAIADVLALRDAPVVVNCIPDNAGGTAPCLEPVTDFDAIVDFSLRNLAVTHESGIDLELDKQFETRIGLLDASISSTSLVKFDRQITAAAPSLDILQPAETKAARQRGLETRAMGREWNHELH